jgi:hypothetical protein
MEIIPEAVVAWLEDRQQDTGKGHRIPDAGQTMMV